MKKLVFALPLVLLLACNTSSESNTEMINESQSHDVEMAMESTDETSTPADYKTHDPVCNMERMEDWTEFSVYNNDTVKFCSKICKDKFDKEPTKYIVAN